MRIRAVHLERFKRFHDLTIADIPNAKLVVVTGPNGIGKSSLFEGFLQWKLEQGGFRGYGRDEFAYYSRDMEADFGRATISWHGRGPETQTEIRTSIDVRTSYRNEPEFSLRRLDAQAAVMDEQRVVRMIHQDSSVSKNYQRLVSSIIATNAVAGSRSKNIGEVQDDLFGNFAKGIRALFPNSLEFVDIGSPLEGGTFYFKKGAIDRFPYMNLSGGEKAAFDLLLDLSIKRKDFKSTVFCIDEPEAHMGTRLQGELLVQLLELINEDSQLWIGTHSIGMMRKAKELYEANPENVVFLDFSDRNFDQAVQIGPTVPSRRFWRHVLSVALDDISDLVVPDTIVVCEGNPRAQVAGKNMEHDARCYEVILSDSARNVEFVAAGNSSDIKTDRLAVMSTIQKIAKGVVVIPLIDADDHSASERVELERLGYRLLNRRNLQSFLYDDEVIEALCEAVGKAPEKAAAKQVKTEAVKASVARGNAADDLKSAGGTILVELRKILDLKSAGSNQMAFERDTLAPLLRPGMQAYVDLEKSIFG